MRGFLHFVSLMKEIEFVIEIQYYTLKVMCILFERPVTVHRDNQGEIALMVYPQNQTCTKHITVKYYHFQIFFTNGDVEIKMLTPRN